MDGYSENRAELNDLGIDLVAASSDDQEHARETAEKVGFPIGYGVDKATTERIGGYWEPRRNFAQPSEFVLKPDGVIVQLSYSDGPLGRTDAADVLKLIGFLERQKKT